MIRHLITSFISFLPSLNVGHVRQHFVNDPSTKQRNVSSIFCYMTYFITAFYFPQGTFMNFVNLDNSETRLPTNIHNEVQIGCLARIVWQCTVHAVPSPELAASGSLHLKKGGQKFNISDKCIYLAAFTTECVTQEILFKRRKAKALKTQRLSSQVPHE